MADSKAPAIHRILAAMNVRYGPRVAIVDHWPADRLAIGLTRPDAPARLVYIAVVDEDAGRYDAALEASPCDGVAPYRDEGWRHGLDMRQVIAVVAEHLGLDRGGEPAPRPVA